MKFEHSFTVAAPVERVQLELNNPARFMTCVTEAQLTIRSADLSIGF